jgi:hypothetical protein
MNRLFLSVLTAAMCAASFAQTAPKLTLHNNGKNVKGDFFTLGPHTTEFAFKGTVPNFYFKLSYARPVVTEVLYKVLMLDEKGIYANDFKMKVPKGKTEITWCWMVRPGSYTVKLVSPNDDDKVFQTYSIKVTDTVGDRATGNQKAGQAKVWICKDTDDNWNAIEPGGSPEKGIFNWKAGRTFNVMVKNNGKPFGVSFLGFVVHKQGADGRDTDFVNECQTDQIDSKATMWATTSGLPGMTSLPAGTYTLYVIDWSKREINFHSGNLKEYFAKVTIIVN